MSKIFVAAGHGGSDPGAIGGIAERDLAIQVVNNAVAIIKATGQKLGKTLVVVPHEKALVDEVAWINANTTDVGHDVAINVHCNANAGTPGTGTETWYGYQALAQEVNEEIVKVLGLRNRGVKQNNNFWFNSAVKCGSCILELGFINNPVDQAAIQARGAEALAHAIVRASNGTWVNPTPPPVVNPPIVVPPKPEPPVVDPPKPSVPVLSDEDITTNWLVKLLKPVVDFFKKLWNSLSK